MSQLLHHARVSLLVAMLVPGLAQADLVVGVGGGRTNNEFTATINPSVATFDDQDNALKMFFGIDISPNLGFEVEYTDLNSLVRLSSTVQSTEINATALGLSLVARMPVSPNTQAFARFGAARWDSDLVVDGVSTSDSGVDPMIGFGFAYRLQSVPLDLKLEWSQYQNMGQGVTNGMTRVTGQNVDVLWLSIAYRIRLAPGP